MDKAKNEMISAKIIEHSIYNGHELISIEIQNPYGLDNELEKHGMICSNSSSKRAIPFDKIAGADPYLPQDLRENERGMQGFTKVNDKNKRSIHNAIKLMHMAARNVLTDLANKYNLHKQHLNWYLVPFLMQTKIMTANKYWWEKMLELRLDKDADPNVIQIAQAIQEAIATSEPKELKDDEWHLCYITQTERDTLPVLDLLKISSARCARTSYLAHGTTRLSEPEEDVGLFTKLVGGVIKHETPLEHQAKPITYGKIINKHAFPQYWPQGVTHMMKDGTLCSGRLQNYVQFRHLYSTALDTVDE